MGAKGLSIALAVIAAIAATPAAAQKKGAAV